MEDPRTPLHRLADLTLGGDGALERFVRERRAGGRSWRLVARDLLEDTDGKVDITLESLRLWFPDAPAEAAS